MKHTMCTVRPQPCSNLTEIHMPGHTLDAQVMPQWDGAQSRLSLAWLTKRAMRTAASATSATVASAIIRIQVGGRSMPPRMMVATSRPTLRREQHWLSC